MLQKPHNDATNPLMFIMESAFTNQRFDRDRISAGQFKL